MSLFESLAMLQAAGRALHQEHDDAFKCDVTRHGPIIGMMFEFYDRTYRLTMPPSSARSFYLVSA